MKVDELKYSYIRGIIQESACFTFCTSGPKHRKDKIPAFILTVPSSEFTLLTLIRDRLNLKNKIYQYGPRKGSDGHKRNAGIAILIVRDIGQLKNTIIPLIYGNLFGGKLAQFEEWIKKVDSDPDVPEGYKFIHKIYKSGFYDKNPKFIDY